MDRVALQCDTYRLIPSHYPPIQLFENLLEPDELDAAYALESLTNDRLRDRAGDISLVSPEDRVIGRGSTPVMAAFTHIGVDSRFTKGHYGVYYAGLSFETALAESKFSRARLMSATEEPPQVLTMRCYKCTAEGEVVDLRKDPQAHAPDDFSYAQTLAEDLHTQNEMGILYKSVRHSGGECIAALRPCLLRAPAVQAGHYQFHWNGSEITTVMALKIVE
jgi:hypothetical protein